MTWHQSMGHKGPVLRPRRIGVDRDKIQLLLYSTPRRHINRYRDAAILLGPFVPEDGSTTILPIVGKYLPVDVA